MKYDCTYGWSWTKATKSPSNPKEYWSNNEFTINHPFAIPWKMPFFSKERPWVLLEDKVSEERYTERTYHNKHKSWIPATKNIEESSYAIRWEHIWIGKSISEEPTRYEWYKSRFEVFHILQEIIDCDGRYTTSYKKDGGNYGSYWESTDATDGMSTGATICESYANTYEYSTDDGNDRRGFHIGGCIASMIEDVETDSEWYPEEKCVSPYLMFTPRENSFNDTRYTHYTTKTTWHDKHSYTYEYAADESVKIERIHKI